MKTFVYTSFLVVFLLSSKAGAQPITTKGKEFYVSFYRNADNNTPNETKIFLTGSVNTSGNIRNPYTGFNLPFTVTTGNVTVVNIPLVEAYNDVLGIVRNRGLIVTAADTIAVFGLSSQPYSSDATVILQKAALGTDYLVASYKGVLNNFKASCFVVEATEDNTVVSITPSVKTSTGNLPGVTFTVTLNQAQTYFIKAESNDPLNADLSGSTVSVTNGCKPIAVFTGNEIAPIPDEMYGASDILYEQLFPISSFGKQFITATLKGRNVYRVKVYAAYNNTSVNIDGTFAATVNAGKFYEFESLNQPKYITTDRPVQVMMFAASTQYDNLRGSANDGDPTMITIPPLEQQLKESIFLSPAMGAISSHKVSIVCKTVDAGTTLLDGINIGNSFSTVFGNPVYSHAAIDISAGQHTITNDRGFIAYSYGFGNAQGYGYCTGSSVEKINTYFTCNQAFSIGNPTVDVCTGVSVFDIITSDPNNTSYIWNFGDGSPTVTTNGSVLQQLHSYAIPGIYVVKLTTVNGTVNACSPGNASVTQLTLNVQASLTPSLSIVSSPANPVCIGSTVSFVASPVNGGANPSYQWKLNGVNVGNNGPTYTKSNLANNDIVSCTMTSTLTCASSPTASSSLIMTLSTIYAPNIMIATTSTNVCVGSSATFTASSLGTQPSAQYQWKVNGINTGGNAPTFTYLPVNGDVVSCVITTSNNNCGATNTANSNNTMMSVVNSGTASVNITASQSPVCVDSAVTFTALPVNGGTNPSYQWKLNGNNAGTNSATYVVSQLKNADVISCVMRSNFSCAVNPVVTSNSITIMAYLISLGNDTTLCEGQTKILDATTSNSTYLWQDGTTLPTYMVTQRGSYNVRVSIPGCVLKDTVNIDYQLKPGFTLGGDKTICLGNSYILKPLITNGVTSQGLSYLWQDGSISPTYTITQQGVYKLVISNLCGSTSDDISITKGVCELYVPNAFTPNGDTKNDVFKVGSGYNSVEFEIQIFNRYGQLVFETKDKTKGWDGTVNGKPQQQGTYTWGIRYKTVNGSLWQELRGTVLLLR